MRTEPMRELILPFLHSKGTIRRCAACCAGRAASWPVASELHEHMAKSPLQRQMTFEALCHSMNAIITAAPYAHASGGKCGGCLRRTRIQLRAGADMALAADNASFTLAYSKSGRPTGCVLFLPRTLGLKAPWKWLYSASAWMATPRSASVSSIG
jgi:hypothetical protein